METKRIGTNANSIFKTIYPDPTWIVPGFIPAGMTLLAGRPKAGKSWIALQVSREVSSGGELFGEQIEQGRVLYLALEDNNQRLKKRMQIQQWGEKSRKNTEFITFRTFVDKIGFLHLGIKEGDSKVGKHAERLYKEVEDGKYRLVVIDTFSNAFLGLKNIDDNQIMTLVMKPLQEISLSRNIGTIVLDHHNKMSEQAPNLTNDILGSTAKVSISDTVIGVYRKGKDERRLLATGKDIEDFDVMIKKDNHFIWTREDILPGLTHKDQQLFEILVSQNHNGARLSKLAEMTGEAESNVSTRLAKLRNLGFADKTKDGFIAVIQIPL